MADSDNQRPILIKKKKSGHGHGHHGGAWKVAYADFVTAMMAFFLLLWLISSTSEEQKEGIADYFTPTTLTTDSSSGSDGILGGQTITADGAARDDRSPMGFGSGLPSRETRIEGGAAADQDQSNSNESDGEGNQTQSLDQDTLSKAEETIRQRRAEQDAAAFRSAKNELMSEIADRPELAGLKENLLVDQTDEGLRIQLIDQQGTDMFPSGSAEPHEHTVRLLDMVSSAIDGLPNRVAISGHTDSTPYRDGSNYGNWELSSDRANASRRAMIESGLEEGRVETVVGKADTDPLDPQNTTAPRNRRISIVLLRQGRGSTATLQNNNDAAAIEETPDGDLEQNNPNVVVDPPETSTSGVDENSQTESRETPLPAPSLLAN
ncbi:MAG: flagellar motor protein MotB [Pseudomonadota bacterium]